MKKIIILIGPESSATRLFTSILSQHPMINGTIEAERHSDILDNIWDSIEENNELEAENLLNFLKDGTYLTRRSVPHGRKKNAIYMQFPNIDLLISICKKINIEIVFFVTTRSIIPNLASWTLERSSCGKDYKKAFKQYQETYKYIFKAIIKNDIVFYILSLESLLLDKKKYINQIFHLIGLDEIKLKIRLNKKVNDKRYKDFQTLINRKPGNST